ncbi:MAG: 50S ribosomal protein L18 [Methanobacteriota archaeon]|nr:MAG: 50S ribosomal protein L18 [Euryarchaeota archaeon]
MGRATSPAYKMSFRRRREGKTVYEKRLALVKSGKPRLVVRRSNRSVIAHIVEFGEKGDKTVVSVGKKELQKLGWEVRRNTPTAYLVGLLAGKEALAKGIKEAVLDIGLNTPTKNAIVFAAAKGASDAGLNLNFNGELDEGRIKGEHIAAHGKAKNAKEVPALFEELKAKILKA